MVGGREGRESEGEGERPGQGFGDCGEDLGFYPKCGGSHGPGASEQGGPLGQSPSGICSLPFSQQRLFLPPDPDSHPCCSWETLDFVMSPLSWALSSRYLPSAEKHTQAPPFRQLSPASAFLPSAGKSGSLLSLFIPVEADFLTHPVSLHLALPFARRVTVGRSLQPASLTPSSGRGTVASLVCWGVAGPLGMRQRGAKGTPLGPLETAERRPGVSSIPGAAWWPLSCPAHLVGVRPAEGAPSTQVEIHLWPCGNWLQPSSLVFLGHSWDPPGSLPVLATPRPSLHLNLQCWKTGLGPQAAAPGGSQTWPMRDLPPRLAQSSPCLFKPKVLGCLQAPPPHVCKSSPTPHFGVSPLLALLASSLAPALASLWQLMAPSPTLCSSLA